MYRNKYTLPKRLFNRVQEIFPPAAKIRNLFFANRLARYAKRLDAFRRAAEEEKARTGRSALFTHVEIETFNRCNGECGFCPVNKHIDPRHGMKMTDELFYSIIAQLRELGYAGELCLFSNNESLLDSRIEAFTAHARKELPDARIMLSTNGLLLTPERYEALVDNVDLFYVNNYCDDYKLTPANAEIMRIAQSRPDWWEKTHIVIRYRKEIMSSRGGQAPNKQGAVEKALPVGCTYAATQLVIRPDGKISLCCNDALGKYTLGDLAERSIAEIWWSDGYEDARARLLASRNAFDLCKGCDTLAE